MGYGFTGCTNQPKFYEKIPSGEQKTIENHHVQDTFKPGRRAAADFKIGGFKIFKWFL